MSDTNHGPGLAARLGSLLREELAPFPGRGTSVLRFWLCFSLVIVCSMTLQVPFIALSLLFVFFTSQENTVLTRLSGLILVVGSFLSVALAILVFKLTIDHPALRIALAGAIAFAGVYFMRTHKLGVLGFMVAVAVIYSQTFVDLIESPEQLVRLSLWALPCALYPIVLTLTVNLVCLPADPVRMLTDELRRQTGIAEAQLRAYRTGIKAPLLTPLQVKRGTLALHRHLAAAARGDREFDRDRARHLMRVAAVDRLHMVALHLSRLPREALTPESIRELDELTEACASLGVSLQQGTTFARRRDTGTVAATAPDTAAALRAEMREALAVLAETDRTPAALLPAKPEGGWVEDAFTNPVYAQFAFKTIVTALLCYAFYNGVQWPGIHTALITCIILALPSLGATSHKGITRIIGCALGSAAALIATVFLIPRVDGIVGLLLISTPVFLAGAWIAAGSARSNYIGVQLVFSYALALFGSFGPTTDVTEIRDRMLGILLAVGGYVVVSVLVWPEREGTQLQHRLARLLDAIAALARLRLDPKDPYALDEGRRQVWVLLQQNRELQARVALEPGWQFAHDSVTRELTTWLATAQETALAIDLLQQRLRSPVPSLPAALEAAGIGFRTRYAERLERAAERLQFGAADESPASPYDPSLVLFESAGSGFGPLLAAARAADEQLRRLEEGLPSGLIPTKSMPR